MRPILTTGKVAPYVSTADIWSMIFSFSRMRIADSSLNDSTQSPACTQEGATFEHARKAVPELARLAGEDERRVPLSRSSAAAAAVASGHSGCWSAGRSRQDSGDQVGDVTAM